MQQLSLDYHQTAIFQEMKPSLQCSEAIRVSLKIKKRKKKDFFFLSVLLEMEESHTAKVISLRTCMHRKNKLQKWMTQYITLINDSDGNNSIGDKYNCSMCAGQFIKNEISLHNSYHDTHQQPFQPEG